MEAATANSVGVLVTESFNAAILSAIEALGCHFATEEVEGGVVLSSKRCTAFISVDMGHPSDGRATVTLDVSAIERVEP